MILGVGLTSTIPFVEFGEKGGEEKAGRRGGWGRGRYDFELVVDGERSLNLGALG